ncbi:hypothetical protein QOZ80_2BG0160860 [Eleusine coracana subsp. coracana]|nr:hypothetical protein QOZ80_2BG0160860 [Eleusine coracana subsp. coracana]
MIHMSTTHGHAVAAVVLAVAGLVLVALTPLAAGIPWAAPCDGNTTGNYTSNSVYAANLRAVAAALLTNVSATPALFATAASGASPNKVYALGQCRGDQDATACRDCIAAAFGNAPRLCPEKKAAAVFYDVCQIGFSDRDFLASTVNSPDQEVQFINAQNVSADIAARFNATAYQLFHAMADYVASSSTISSSPKRFVTAAVGFDDATYPKIYGVASCTPDLTSGQCRGCLAEAIDEYSQEFPHNAKGARITGMRCALRYEVYPFYNGTSMLQLPGTQAGKKSETGKILAIVLPTVIAVVAIIAMLLCFWRRTKSKRSPSSASHMEEIESIESLLIDLSTLRLATDNFSKKNKLGEGGFGEVYKGALPNSQQIAVKRLSQNSRQGIGELKNELALIAKLQHKNLVRLVGVCLQEEEKLLVYEYMPNTSLDTFLFDTNKRKQLDWSKRFNIIKGIARGLQYLHEDSQLKIIHRDLKASNVLLDADMNPKISDFGLARLFGGDQSQDTTNRVVGTYGYMAPEYALRGQYSLKSDIYSFGVLILEILTGMRNSDTYNSDQPVDLPSLIWEHWTMKAVMEMIDPYLRNDYSSQEDIFRCVHIGLSCVQEDPVDRPNISVISVMLDSSTIPSQDPARPAFYVEMSGNFGSGLYSESCPRVEPTTASMVMSPNELSITDPEPR